MGSILRTAADPLGLTGDNMLTNVLKGKKDPGQAAVTTNFNSAQGTAAQNQLIDKFSTMGNQDFSGMANAQTAQQENQARQNVADQTMKAQQMVAQRGLGNTSMGLSAMLGQGQSLGNEIGQIRANRPMLENQMKMQNLNAASQGINSILGQQAGAMTYTPAVASKGRQGGLMGIAGAGIGAMMGGPAGAQVGMGMGNALSQA